MRMKRNLSLIPLFSLLIILIVPIPTLEIQAEDRGGLYEYTYVVHESGWIDIITRFRGDAAGKTWVLVPKFQEYEFKVLRGAIRNERLVKNTSYYFYSNLSFEYDPGTEVKISFSYRFGALIVEPNGAFFSTQIAFSQLDDAVITVKMPKTFVPHGIEPGGYERFEEGESLIVRYRLDGDRNNTMRVLIAFKVIDGQEFKRREVGKMVINYPPRYEDVVENITRYYQKVLPKIMELTAVNEEIPIEVKLFVPETMEEITTLGFTGPRLTSDIISQGEVHLNMMLVRMPESELPSTFTHELLHQYMQVAGLSVELRWAHEGLAQYLSAYIIKEVFGMEELTNPELDHAVLMATNGDFSFLLDWRGGGLPGDPGLYYAASYILIREIGERYGGPELFKRFFEEVRKDGEVIDEFGEFVRYLQRTAGRDISEVFKEFGMDVEIKDPQLAKLVDSVRQYSESTKWFNPLAGIASEMVRNARDRSSATAALLVVLSGLVISAVLMSGPLWIVIYIKRKRSGGLPVEITLEGEKAEGEETARRSSPPSPAG